MTIYPLTHGTAGVSVLSTGKDIMMDIFGSAPASAALVTGGFASTCALWPPRRRAAVLVVASYRATMP